MKAAAILHDIGIHEAERKHGSAGGKYQEMEGPPIARQILERVGVDAERAEHVCRIVGSHHSGRGIDTPEFRVIWDADWLVNLFHEEPRPDVETVRTAVDRAMKTATGRELARLLASRDSRRPSA